MTPSSAFRILRIRPLLRLNGTIDRVEALQCKCLHCADEARYSEPGGLGHVESGIELTCPACGTTGMFTNAELLAAWIQQVRRDRVLALAGIDAETLYMP